MNNPLTDNQLTTIIKSAEAVISALAGTNDDVHPDNSTEMCRLYDWLNDNDAPPEVVLAMACEIQERRKAAAEPIYQLINDDWYDTDKDTYEMVVEAGGRGRIVYAAPPPAADNHDILRRLAVIMSGSDTPGEIRSLTVTAQSLVDRCKQLAREKQSGKTIMFSNPSAPSIFETLRECPQAVWKPAGPEELSKRSVRESDILPSREEIQGVGETISCPRCGEVSNLLPRAGGKHYWCDSCGLGESGK